jgi:hypothetical protein
MSDPHARINLIKETKSKGHKMKKLIVTTNESTLGESLNIEFELRALDHLNHYEQFLEERSEILAYVTGAMKTSFGIKSYEIVEV